MNKLKAITRSVSFNTHSVSTNKSKNCGKEKTEPVVGFQLTLYEAANDNGYGT
jgi:hypothetical protein